VTTREQADSESDKDSLPDIACPNYLQNLMDRRNDRLREMTRNIHASEQEAASSDTFTESDSEGETRGPSASPSSPLLKHAGVLHSPRPPGNCKSARSSPDRSSDSEQEDLLLEAPTTTPTTNAVSLLEGKHFKSLDAAISVAYDAAEKEGFKLVADSQQRAPPPTGAPAGAKGMTISKRFRCASWKKQRQARNDVDPANQRTTTKPGRQRCSASLKIRAIKGGQCYYMSKVSWTHNHPPHYDSKQGGKPPDRPTVTEKNLVRTLMAGPPMNVGRSGVQKMLQAVVGDSRISKRQVSNLMNEAKRTRLRQAADSGGDIGSLMQWLTEQKNKDARFRFSIFTEPCLRANTAEVEHRVCRIFVSSAEMIDCLHRYGDVIIADVCHGRNVYNLPLHIFCVIDGTGTTRNVGYVVHADEKATTHTWALQQLLEAAGTPPEVIVSDHDAAFTKAVKNVMPSTHHIYACGIYGKTSKSICVDLWTAAGRSSLRPSGGHIHLQVQRHSSLAGEP